MKQINIYLKSNDRKDALKFFSKIENDGIASSIHFALWRIMDGDSAKLYPYEIVHACALLKQAGKEDSRLFGILSYYL